MNNMEPPTDPTWEKLARFREFERQEITNMPDTNESLFAEWFDDASISELLEGMKEQRLEVLHNRFQATIDYDAAFEAFVEKNIPNDIRDYKLEAFGGE